MADSVLSIPCDYSSSPAGRTRKDGPFNGARFRDDFLVPQLRAAAEKGGRLVVNFDNADSYSSSFLEEAFGGLVRLHAFEDNVIRGALELRADDPVFAPYVRDARSYLDDELKKVARR